MESCSCPHRAMQRLLINIEFMLDIKNGIRSLSDFKQNSSEILNYINKTHSPAVLTINGKAEAVILDPESYQKMVNKIALLESSHKIKKYH